MEDKIIVKTAEEFVRLRTCEDYEQQVKAAYVELSDEIALKVIEDYPEMKRWVIHNKTVSLKILEFLSNDNDPDIRSRVAVKNKISMDLVVKLSKDSDPNVKVSIIYNKKTPVKILEELMLDKDSFVSAEAQEVYQYRLESNKKKQN